MTKHPSEPKEKIPKDLMVGTQTSEQQEIAERMRHIKHKIIILSGKGGVGKTTVAINLATSLAWQGHTIGILDADIHGPDVPKMLGLEGARMVGGDKGLEPVIGPLNILTVSMEFLLQSADTPVIWRGPLKMRVISEFLSKVNWGSLDYLIIDLPPGTGDESLSIMQLLPDLDGVIIVTTPQEVALLDSRKAASMVRQMNVPILGLIENMSGFHCPHCGEVTNIFGKGGGKNAAKELNLFFLGDLPFDHRVMLLSDEGKPFIVTESKTPVAQAFQKAVERLITRIKHQH
ncbi:MAG: Mrp/NBP35 family ATP-binding protein [Candidatus Hermodarchaeota archaeon]|jgi:ATP-binding protein involved in chromosome partitioning|nr:Mrp/NBP35 family ATP-binding protein [Candidatus Hermodarchaeota archaeon]